MVKQVIVSSALVKFVRYYLANADRNGKYYYSHQIGSRMLAFDRHIYIWPCPVLKVNVHVVHISTANVSEIMTDMTNNTIAIK